MGEVGGGDGVRLGEAIGEAMRLTQPPCGERDWRLGELEREA